MTELAWDEVGERLYETGVDHGVLYKADGSGGYEDGVPWNGLTTVTESPTGAEANKQYADNIIYLNLYSIEEFGGTIEAYTYPDEFAECDGTVVPTPGLTVGQQSRKQFGLAYRSRLGNDVDGSGSWVQAPPDLRGDGISFGEGVRHDQRLSGADWIQLGHLRRSRMAVTGLKPCLGDW
jgi:hypothetical protein